MAEERANQLRNAGVELVADVDKMNKTRKTDKRKGASDANDKSNKRQRVFRGPTHHMMLDQGRDSAEHDQHHLLDDANIIDDCAMDNAMHALGSHPIEADEMQQIIENL